MTEMIGHIAETAGHDEPKTRSVTMDRNRRSRSPEYAPRQAVESEGLLRVLGQGHVDDGSTHPAVAVFKRVNALEP